VQNSRTDEIIKTIQVGVGLALIGLAVVFLWRGISAIGSVGIDFPFFSGHINTTSAGLALLIVGTILIVSSRRNAIDIGVGETKAISVIIIGVVFYLIIGLLPLGSYIALIWYLHKFHAEKANDLVIIFGYLMLFIWIPILLWVVGEVKALIGGGPKR
jgi:hypothetical protein